MSDSETLDALQQRLKVRFKEPSLLERALRHRSVVLEAPRESNERLEFLGDSIVGMVVCEALFARFPDVNEGVLAKAKAYLASEPVLAEAALKLGLDEAVTLSPAEEASGGRLRKSILSDAFEAVIAAVFLDCGMRAARRIVRGALAEAMERVARDDYQRDFKSMLQERTQAVNRRTPHYTIKQETGADHDKTFVARAVLGTKIIGEGAGKSKKEAEQAAAEAALRQMA
jgi:ribonuclease III